MIFVLPLLLYPLLGMSLFQVVQFRRTQPTSVLVVGLPRLDAGPDLIRNGGFNPELFSKDEGDSARDSIAIRAAGRQGSAAGREGRGPAGRGPPRGAVGPLRRRPVLPGRFRRQRAGLSRGRSARGPSWDGGLAENKFPFQGDSPIFVGRKSGQSPEAAPRIPSPEIMYTTANERSQNGCNRLVAVLERWREELGKSNLAAGGVPASAASPFSLEKKDIAEETSFRGAAMWSKILPVMLLIWAMTGAFYPAIDLCAGEKERGTLETLLSSPAERSEIVLGKLLTVMMFSMATAVLNLVSMGVAGWLIFGQATKFGPPPPLAPLWLAIALVPISALYSALCLALAALARSTREGQYYLVPLLLVTMPLAVLPMAPGVELTLGNSLIPVTGVVLLLRSAIEGAYWQALQYLPVVLGVTLAACVLAVRWAVDQFNSETVLFRESEQLDVGLWLRHVLHDRQPTPTVAAAALCGILILMIRFFLSGFAGQIENFAHLVRLQDPFGRFALLTLVVQIAGVFFPALLMAIMFTSSPRQTLLLRHAALDDVPCGDCPGRGPASDRSCPANRRRAALPYDARNSGKTSRNGRDGDGGALVAIAAVDRPVAGPLRGIGLPRLHPFRIPPLGPSLAGHRLQCDLLRRRTQHPPATASCLRGRRGPRPVGGADAQPVARRPLPPDPQFAAAGPAAMWAGVARRPG